MIQNAARRSDKVVELLKTYPVVIDLPVIWVEMDAFKHVNNVNYFRYLETSRVTYLEQVRWLVQREQGVGPILASVSARFRKPLFYPDTISVGARVTSLEDDRFSIEHVIVSHNQEVVTTEGQGTVVAFDYNAHQKASIPTEIRQRIEQLEGDRGA